jgi:patatin-like phospholipase/acyl hydrolase
VTIADPTQVDDGRPFRVLSIDGGGIRGIVPTIVIAEIERRTGQSASRLSDLIAGTSTGGIIALGLAMPGANGAAAWRAEELIEIYARDGAKMFPPAPFGELRAMFRQRYDEAQILALLHGYFGNTLLSQACCDVMVTTYDVLAREAWVLTSRRAQEEAGFDLPLRVAAQATAAAPTYFAPVQATFGNPPRERVLIDGSVFANNPSMCAFTEVQRRRFGSNIVVVSLGTGSLTRRYQWADVNGWGLAHWARPLLHIVVDGAGETVDFQLRTMLGEDHYHRFQIPLKHASDDLDDASPENIEKLREEAQRLIEGQDRELDGVCQQLTDS